jgi:hypothetical protein
MEYRRLLAKIIFVILKPCEEPHIFLSFQKTLKNKILHFAAG